MRIVASVFAVTCVAAALSSCGDNGGPYGPYGNTYSAPCRDDYDCAGMYCAEVQGGICLPACRGDYDCGAGYVCRSRDRHGAGGKVNVCVVR